MIDKDQITPKLSSFHTLPIIAHQLLAVLNRTDSDASDISRVIGLDYALTANVLRAANSAYFGFSKSVSSLTDASFRLGTGLISQIAISSIVYANVRRSATGYGQTAEDLWRHSAAVAVTSDNLCRALQIRNCGAIFTAALVHDIGKAILESWVSEHHEEIQTKVTAQGMTFEQAEKHVLGYDHAEVGAMVAEHWHFPSDLMQAIRWHHDPNAAPAGQPGVDVVHVADAICIMQGIGLGCDGLSYRPCPEAIERLSLTSAGIETVTSQLLDSLKDIEEVLKEQPAAAGVGR
jgi:putative nucleotidyltransferase with HDIG domain